MFPAFSKILLSTWKPNQIKSNQSLMMSESLGNVSKFHFQYLANLSELINVHSPWYYQKIVGSLIISGGVEVNYFT